MNRVYIVGQRFGDGKPSPSRKFQVFINHDSPIKTGTRWYESSRDTAHESPASTLKWMNNSGYNRFKLELIYD